MNHGKYALKILSHCNYLYVKSLILELWSHVSAFIYTMETKIVLRGKRMFFIIGGALYRLEDGGLPVDKCVFLRLGRRAGQTQDHSYTSVRASASHTWRKS